VRMNRGVGLLVCLFLAGSLIVAQSPNGTVSGIVLDPSGGLIVGADVLVINNATGVQYPGKANSEGYYVVPNIPPGNYRIQVSNSGFKTIIKPDIVIHVEDALAINFTMPIGSASEIVTVEGGAPLINTESAAVGTVVDRKYVENMPLNGRSFQDLILLTPGVVTNSPQISAGNGTTGEFSVNGQRLESNYYTVDGVSANLGVSISTNTPGVTGSLPTSTALGTTQGLVSVDALQEFRVQSSTYSAEYGRNPGGQFSFVTRSGTNDWHGTAFDYLRNNAFDANDWFNDYYEKPEPPERQNDFGGTFGGPIELPRIYRGKDRTFFFFSYEGLRLDQPQPATLVNVPAKTLRTSAPAPLQPVLNAFPVPNAADLGNGFAEFVGSWSNPSRIDAISARLDQVINDKLHLYFRFGDTSSNVGGPLGSEPSVRSSNSFSTQTYTFGATASFSNTVSNELRLNFSTNRVAQSNTSSNFGGATPVDVSQVQGFASGSNPVPQLAVGFIFGSDSTTLNLSGFSGQQKQWNLVDSVGLSLGQHQFKFGVDFRRLDPRIYQASPAATYFFLGESSVLANSVFFGNGISTAPAFPVYTNISTFAQDDWKLTGRLNLLLGLRWEVNPAPGAAKGNLPYTVEGNSLSTWTLAPQGTPLWKTGWFNFAPRLGATYVLRSNPGFETVVRGGAGVFFDTGQQNGSFGYGGPGFSSVNRFGTVFASPATFPVPATEAAPAIVNPPVAPYTSSTVYAFPAHLQLPFTLQWNVSIDQALNKSQVLTVSYVGANGRKLLEQNQLQLSGYPLSTPINPNFGTVIFSRNGLTSDYNGLQVQYRRRLTQGLQVLASYSLSHCLDYGSRNGSLPYERGNCDFDVRQNFSSALSYDLPDAFRRRSAAAVFHHWGVDDRFAARTGFPVTLNGIQVIDAGTGQTYNSGLNVNPGMPLYVRGMECADVYNNGKGCPGGWAINPGAFSLPTGCNSFSCPPGSAVGNAPRNFVRGFGIWQMDFAVRREFPIYERLKLQFRAEAFNIFNHPNFGTMNSTYCSPPAGPGCTFGQATATLAQSLGSLSQLYQMGGPRSWQFALKLAF
jgi:hypothetical protein